MPNHNSEKFKYDEYLSVKSNEYGGGNLEM